MNTLGDELIGFVEDAREKYLAFQNSARALNLKLADMGYSSFIVSGNIIQDPDLLLVHTIHDKNFTAPITKSFRMTQHVMIELHQWNTEDELYDALVSLQKQGLA